jgi:heme oxygenase
MTDVSQPGAQAPEAVSLVQRMRVRTRELHARAEQSGIVAAILAGQATSLDYAIYLRNLLPVYQAMEQALEQHRDRPGIGALVHPSLFRAASIQADLDCLAGPGWADALPQVRAGQQYVAQVARAGGGDGGRLIAHAYTRYLGDLNGGQVLRRKLVRRFGPDFPAVRFLEFPAITDIRGSAAAFHAALDAAADQLADPGSIVQEAAIAFELNIALSQEVAGLQSASQRTNEPAPNNERIGRHIRRTVMALPGTSPIS